MSTSKISTTTAALKVAGKDPTISEDFKPGTDDLHGDALENCDLPWLDDQVTFHLLRNKSDTDVSKPRTFSWRELLSEVFGKHRAQPEKDGPCVIGSEFLSPAGGRKDANVKSVSFIQLDFDNSKIEHRQTQPDDIGKVWMKRRGFGGRIYSTYSHSGALTKFRVVLPMKQQFHLRDSVDDPNGQARVALFKRTLKHLADDTGQPYDVSCVNPARLFYTPAYNENDPEAEGLCYSEFIPGNPVDFDKLAEELPPEPTRERKPKKQKDTAAKSNAEEKARAGGVEGFKTHGMTKFLAKWAAFFEIEIFLEAKEWVSRGTATTGTAWQCPNEPAHTPPKPGEPPSKGFFAQNSSARDTGFGCACLHDHCKKECKEATGKENDRGWFLDLLCVELGIKHAKELLAWCPGRENDEWDDGAEKESIADRSAFKKVAEMISGLGEKTPTPDDCAKLFKALGSLPQTDIETEGLKTATREMLGVDKPFINKAVKAAQDAIKAKERLEAVNEDKGKTVWPKQNFEAAVEKTIRLFEAGNKARPRVYYNAFCSNDGRVRIEPFQSKIGFDSMSNKDKWAHELSLYVRCKTFNNLDMPISISAPDDLISRVRGHSSLKMPICNTIVRLPVFSKAGTLRTRKGYDEMSASYLAPWGNFREVPTVVTAEHLDEAFALFELTLRDFPFTDVFDGVDPLPVRVDGDVDDDGFALPNYERGVSSRANVFAMLLTPIVRNMIEGSTPIHFVDKSKPGTGAGFLIDLLSTVVEGKRTGVTTLAPSADEVAKQVTAKLRSGDAVQVYDNINHHVDSADLASALTGGTWKGRILGVSEMTDIEIGCTWVFSANNGSLSYELMDRTIPIRMDAATDNPSADRKPDFYKLGSMGFTYQQWIAAKRLDLVWALHVLVRNWLQERAKPGWKYEGAVFSRFEAYSEVVGGILQAAGVPGFLDNRADYMATRDDAKTADKEALTALFKEFSGPEGFTVDNALTVLAPVETMIFDILPDDRKDRNKTADGLGKAVGHWLTGIAKGGVHKLENGLEITVSKARTNQGRKYFILPK